MNLITKILFLISGLVLNGRCSEIGVPVLLWHQKADEIIDNSLFDSKSTVNQIDANVLSDDYMNGRQTIVAFVQNRISLEQFTGNDQDKLSAIRTVFRDPSIKPTLLTDVLNPTQALQTRHFRREEWSEPRVQIGDKIWIQLPEESLVKNNELLSQMMAKITKNISKDILFLITGRQNDFSSIDLEPEVHRSPRKVRQAAPAADDTPTTATPSTEDKHLVNYTGCLYLYTTKISLSFFNNSNEAIVGFNTSETGYTLGSDNQCWVINNKTGKQEKKAVLHVLYKYINKTSTPNQETDLELKFDIDSGHLNKSDFWRITNATAKVMDSVHMPKPLDFKLRVKEIASEDKFSYSCYQMSVLTDITKNSSGKDNQLAIKFTRFQLQPFWSKTVFTESYDCQVWLTLPLWMGLLTLLLLFMILYVGLYFVSIISTPDRFENPKAKPLIITNVDE